MKRVVHRTARWGARISGLLLLGLVAVIAVGEGAAGHGPNWMKMGGMGRAMLVAGLVSLAGMVALWWREAWGGALVIGGIAAFYALNFWASGKFPGGAFPLFYVPGVLALLAAAIEAGPPGKPQKPLVAESPS